MTFAGIFHLPRIDILARHWGLENTFSLLLDGLFSTLGHPVRAPYRPYRERRSMATLLGVPLQLTVYTEDIV